jgi:hypothetical protein
MAPSDPNVMVFGEAVVGPYETATIGSDDPAALVGWLQDNGYAVPDSILPVITHYVELGLNFAALKLNPNAGVNQMQPVRITTAGAMPVFPLRMVAAGVSDSVTLDLYVFGEGRYEAQNFDVIEIDPSRLVYDWAETRFNYNEVFGAMLAEAGSRTWVAEYAQPARAFQGTLESYISYDDEGTVASTSKPDFDIVTRSIPEPYLTRLRAELTVEELSEDLVLQAALDQPDLSNFIQVDNEINRPAEPSCPTTCTDPTRVGGTSMPGTLGFRDGGGDGVCAIGFGNSGAPLALLGVGIAAAAFGLRRRRR